MSQINRKEAERCMKRSNGDAVSGMVFYIAKNGCNGFRCKGCVLGKLCSHKPSESRDYALRLMGKAMGLS